MHLAIARIVVGMGMTFGKSDAFGNRAFNGDGRLDIIEQSAVRKYQ